MRKTLFTLFVLHIFTSSTSLEAQRFDQPTSSEIYQKIEKLGVLGNVLYLAAHPDDENTRFIAYSANHKLFNTSYLSLTRGDGGQNLIGPELREELGIIRTQELLAARRLDGGDQYFTRANDFGYSKTPKETLEIWDKDKILSDVVWVIRQVRPDVIVCRFPTSGGGGHGHHTASAILALEAFEVAGDPGTYTEQLDHVEPWQPLRIVVNTGRWWNPDISADDPNVVAMDIGTYDVMKGISHTELASQSRTMHKSQGFGSTGTRGERIEYFEHLAGEPAESGLFEGYPKDWSRVKGSERCKSLTSQLIRDYDLTDPAASIPRLLELRRALQMIKDDWWREKKTQEIDAILQDCNGLYIEARTDRAYGSAGDSLKLEVEVIARGSSDVKLKSISSEALQWNETIDEDLEENRVWTQEHATVIPDGLDVSQPYWLREEGSLGTYTVEEPLLRGTPENEPAIAVTVTLLIDGQEVEYETALFKKWNDPVLGEQGRPFAITPPVFINIEGDNLIFPDKKAKKVQVTVKAIKEGLNGQLFLEAPANWTVEPALRSMSFESFGQEQKLTVTITPGAGAKSGEFKAFFRTKEDMHDRSLSDIAYDHIPAQVYMPNSVLPLITFDIQKKGERIAYIPGAGDVVADGLRNLGYQVDELSEADLNAENLKDYDAVITGIRLMNVDERIDFYMPELLAYAEAGGTLVIQYNTRHRMKTELFAPYPITLSRDRVTEEDSEVTFLAPDHPVLNRPNKISQADFEGWVQERGLYF
ncbi:MAG: PIG-L family deacetylase, partial [Flavobacteriales bacterium]|nr:PIG-L family deacetylase [Flavobacteriales bacterium]